MNAERIRRVADMIERVGDSHKVSGRTLSPSQKGWLHIGYDQGGYLHDCGTPACIAGFAAALAEDKDERADLTYSDSVLTADDVPRVAERWLDLTIRQADQLFDGEPFGEDDPDSPDDLRPTAREAVDCLRRLADTGEVYWRQLR